MKTLVTEIMELILKCEKIEFSETKTVCSYEACTPHHKNILQQNKIFYKTRDL